MTTASIKKKAKDRAKKLFEQEPTNNTTTNKRNGFLVFKTMATHAPFICQVNFAFHSHPKRDLNVCKYHKYQSI